jgi:diguanylate cyclase (GGDEF)-like protein
MPTEQVNGLIQFIGIVSQFFGAVLLVALFALLRTRALHRDYFDAWAWAWLSMMVAIGAMITRWLLVPTFDARLVNASFQNVRGTYLVYQVAKLLYFSFLVLGTAAYVRGTKSRVVRRGVIAAAVAYATGTVLFSPSFRVVILWQVPMAVAAYLFCAHALLTVPRSRRSVGNRATAIMFSFVATWWALYFAAFNYVRLPEGTVARAILETIVRFNGYADLLLQMLLGYGMVVMLMEDAKREVDDAHAELAVAHHQLLRVSLYDSLTGSLNRRAFAEGVGLEAAKHTFGCVVIGDTDNLKLVNDAYGHRVGDQLLQQIAVALRGSLTSAGRLYRWGGDEFLLVFPGARASEVEDRVQALLDGAQPLRLDRVEDPIELLISVGAADYAGGEEMTAAIESADRQMYLRKERRRAERQARVAALPSLPTNRPGIAV